MTAVNYEIWLARDDGTRLQLLDTAVHLTYTRVVNNVGHFRLALPANVDRKLLVKDRRINIWRKPEGGILQLAFVGLIRRVVTTTDSQGRTTRTVSGYDLTGLL
jgi:hypothetical protein